MEQFSEAMPYSSSPCPSPEIAAYIDGELSPTDELTLEGHLLSCCICAEELNAQKELVNELNISLDRELELPADFTKRIVAHAESNVNGLRRPGEWLNAVFVCVALLFFILFSLGAR